tara:strand:- start:1882 stop:2253 length:372 start_codon:yes stop_codon:yes gene_type:complete
MLWKKVWTWVKHYWYIPAVLIYTLVLWLVFRNSNTNALKVLDIAKESYQKEIKAIKLSHEKESREREEIVVIYQNTLKKLEKEHNVEVGQLTKRKQKEIKKLVNDHKDNPSALADEMKRLFEV